MQPEVLVDRGGSGCGLGVEALFEGFFFVNRRGSVGYILDGGAKVQFVERKRNDQLSGAASA